MNKYHNVKTYTTDGITHDSEKEAVRWCELRLLERAGEISGLQRQVKYVLVPSQHDEKGKLIERELSYIADFRYHDCRTGETVVEDVKGLRTKEYIIKRKLMLYLRHIRIREV